MLSIASLSVIRVHGPDASTFLQGQLSQDISRLGVDQALLASCNSAQGRVQAVFTLIQHGEQILLLLPTSLMEATLARLRKYVMRAKVNLEDGRNQYAVYLDTAMAWPGITRPLQHQLNGDTSVVGHHDGHHVLLIAPRAVDMKPQGNGDELLTLLNIRAGVPQVFPETAESFVAQMLNLDLLDGISFNKGCYTGQEIIARAHFRGTVKRRMFALSTDVPAPAPGTRILANGELAGEVVMGANTNAGSELLAVLMLSSQHHALALDNAQRASLTMGKLPYPLPNDSQQG